VEGDGHHLVEVGEDGCPGAAGEGDDAVLDAVLDVVGHPDDRFQLLAVVDGVGERGAETDRVVAKRDHYFVHERLAALGG
jgi:hypothetical protein